MAALELLELYPSPWSERVRWALEAKGLRYTRRPYQPIAGEAELVRSTGQRTVPVLFVDGQIVGDSNAALDWLESAHPTPPLLPAAPLARAQVRALEIMATETLAPAARLVMIGHFKQIGLQPLADHFAQKYGWDERAEADADRLLRTLLLDLASAVSDAPYLVGPGFTRADLTVACMLTPALGAPPDELFELDAGYRSMFGVPFAGDARLAPLRAWRDEIYRRHRGGRVLPAAA
ncbi:MAG TPA: glutathione S-transferase [Candidatus Limnocylindria bacterium]|nr:glutathione S-transferase [Candidatus Limnocylindria bacterium]